MLNLMKLLMMSQNNLYIFIVYSYEIKYDLKLWSKFKCVAADKKDMVKKFLFNGWFWWKETHTIEINLTASCKLTLINFKECLKSHYSLIIFLLLPVMFVIIMLILFLFSLLFFIIYILNISILLYKKETFFSSFLNLVVYL